MLVRSTLITARYQDTLHRAGWAFFLVDDNVRPHVAGAWPQLLGDDIDVLVHICTTDSPVVE